MLVQAKAIRARQVTRSNGTHSVLEGGTESEKIISAIQQLHLRMNALDSKVSDKIDDLPFHIAKNRNFAGSRR